MHAVSGNDVLVNLSIMHLFCFPTLAAWLGLDKLCFYFNLLCFSVMLITCAYYAFKVNLLCSIMLQKLIKNGGKYSQIYNCLYQ